MIRRIDATHPIDRIKQIHYGQKREEVKVQLPKIRPLHCLVDLDRLDISTVLAVQRCVIIRVIVDADAPGGGHRVLLDVCRHRLCLPDGLSILSTGYQLKCSEAVMSDEDLR